MLIAAVLWTLTSGTNAPSASGGAKFPGSPWPGMLRNAAVWVFQQVAAVPSRNVIAPLAVYALALAVWGVMLILALRASPGRVRLAMLVIFVSTTALSVALTLLSYAQLGYAWQGRYAWPYVVGWLVLAGWALDRAPEVVPGARAVTVAAAVATGIGGCVTALDVLRSYSAVSPYAGDGWSSPHPLLVCALVVLGVILLLASLLRDGNAPPDATDDPELHVDAREAGRQALIG